MNGQTNPITSHQDFIYTKWCIYIPPRGIYTCLGIYIYPLAFCEGIVCSGLPNSGYIMAHSILSVKFRIYYICL